jgi:hypothetical protein
VSRHDPEQCGEEPSTTLQRYKSIHDGRGASTPTHRNSITQKILADIRFASASSTPITHELKFTQMWLARFS